MFLAALIFDALGFSPAVGLASLIFSALILASAAI